MIRRYSLFLKLLRLAVAMAILSTTASTSSGWKRTKNIADDVIYEGRSTTFYCGCAYLSHGDSDGSGDVTNTDVCGYVGPSKHQSRASRIEWEHIVPASLMPARDLPCWNGERGSRARCETLDPRAQAMLFDLHNLAPAIGQVNALRLNDRYADLSGDTSGFGSCVIEDQSGLFEPPDCKKGDVARVWLYMSLMYSVDIPEE